MAKAIFKRTISIPWNRFIEDFKPLTNHFNNDSTSRLFLSDDPEQVGFVTNFTEANRIFSIVDQKIVSGYTPDADGYYISAVEYDGNNTYIIS